MTHFNDYATLVGRILLAAIFVLAGVDKIGGFEGTAQYMASAGLPLVPLLLVGTIVVEVVGGLSIAAGFKARIGAGALFLFTLLASVVFHAFWSIDDPQQAYVEQLMFMKNLAIMGGLAIIVGRGAGPLSVDARKS